MAIGRISGPLLKANLLREGVDLAFETDLLYLDVDPGRIGINTNTPQYDLDVNGTTQTTTLNVSNLARLGNISISGSGIATSDPVLKISSNLIIHLQYDDDLISRLQIRELFGLGLSLEI